MLIATAANSCSRADEEFGMFGATSGHLRIRLHQFEARESRAQVALRRLKTFVAILPRRSALHAFVLTIAIAAAAAHAGE
jgi:hypothetical protein